MNKLRDDDDDDDGDDDDDDDGEGHMNNSDIWWFWKQWLPICSGMIPEILINDLLTGNN